MTKWEYAATAAASLAHLLIHQQDGVGLTLFDQSIRRQLPVSTKQAALTGIIRAIEETTPSEGTDVRAVFRYLADRVPPRGMVVLISDLLTDFDDIVDGLERIRFGRHEVLVLHVMDHDELEFPFTDQTLFEGMEEAGVEVRTDPQSLRQSYLEAVRAFLGRIRGSCLNHGIDYALLSTADPLDVVLTRFLANRMHRARSSA